MDCFRLRSSSFGGHVVTSLLAMTRLDIDVASYSNCQTAGETRLRIPAARKRPGFAANRVLDEQEGAGNAGCWLHPRALRAKKVHFAHASNDRAAETPGISLRNGFNGCFALSLVYRAC
jgi:hypothetical protein